MSSSSSSSSPATGSAGHGTNASNGKGSNGHGNGNGNGNGSGGRPVSALAAALVGMGTGSSPHSHSHVGHHQQNGHNNGYSRNPRNGFNIANGHSHSHVVQSQPPHIQPHAHPPPYPYPQPPMQTAHQHYAHLAAVATAAAAAAAVSASSASASSTPASSTRTRRSATKPTVSTAQSTSTQPQPVAVPNPKPIRRRTNDPNTPRAEWTWERDQILFDILASVESAKTPIEVGSWSAKHWDLVAQSLSERGIPGNGQQRYAVLRREWRTLCELLKKPGFTWDEAEGKISASEEVWEAHMNSLTVPFHKVAAARLRDKQYPHYQRAKALWGLALKDGPPAITSTVHPSAALAASRDAFAIKAGRPHTPESPPTTLAYKEGSLPPGAVATAASAAGGDSSLSSSHHLLQHHTPAPSAAANGLQQHHQHQLQHHSDLDFLRSPSRDRDDAIFSAQELSDLIGSVPNSTAKSGSMMPSPSLHFDPTAPPPPPPPTSHASFIPPPLIPYPLGSPMLSTNPRKRRAPLLPSSSSHPHLTDLPPPTAKRHKPVTPQVYPPPPFAYQPSMSPVHPHALYGQTSLAPPPPPLHTSDPLYRAVSAAAALAGTSVPGSPLDTDMDHADTAHGRSSPPAPPVPPPSLADAMALAMAWLAGQRAAAGGVDAALMLSAAHVFMQDERVLYMFLALPEDLRVLFLRQRVEANAEAEARGGEVAGGAGQGVDGDV